MNNQTLSSNLMHCGSIRTLHPIEFIERWSLCHHLACVVRYLARAASKSSSLQQSRVEDLKMAQWYLSRELVCKHKPDFAAVLIQPTIQKIKLEACQLSSHLGEVLFHMQVSQKVSLRDGEKDFNSRYMKEASLKQALKHLSEEIKLYEH
jgi:hypothetical protein